MFQRISGALALEMTASTSYDVILMDHLMPELDGIECLLRIRKQSEEINNNTPVIVLTANAGGENKELYTRSGFDGYLLKPVSGVQLEKVLLQFLPENKVIRQAGSDISHEEMNTAQGYRRKVPVLITSSSMCDLPPKVIRELQLDIIAFFVHTNGGSFWDNVEADSDELVRYMYAEKGCLRSEPPKVEEFEDFFANKLKKAHQIIHIALTSSMSEEYERAKKAAENFDNVTVINSESLSSATGILVLIAYQMAQQNQSVERITEELQRVKKQIHCGFVIARTDFMMRSGFLSERTHRLMYTLKLRPSLHIKNDRFGLERIYMGNRRHCYSRYIHRAFPKGVKPDTDLLFITYVGMPEEDLAWVVEEIKKRYDFTRIVFQKASAAISLNCGPGTFGLLYMEKGTESYHLSSLLPPEAAPDEESIRADEETEEEADDKVAKEAAEDTESTENIKDFKADQDVPENGIGTGTRNDRNGGERETTFTGNGSGDGAESGTISHNVEAESEASGSSSGTDSEAWYENLEGIDGAVAIRNSGSESAFRSVLQIFYDSIPAKSEEIEGYYATQDLKNYTIKVHALKSSAKLIGAIQLSEDAQSMENAGKAEDTGYIHAHHASLMDSFRRYREILADIYEKKEKDTEAERKPIADPALMESVYEAFAEAARAMDCDLLEETFQEMEEYAIPESESERFRAIKECADQFDYDKILELLEQE